MSIISKNNSANNSENTEEYLTALHKSYLSSIRLNQKISTDEYQAKKLQAFLRTIKSYQLNQINKNNDLYFSRFWSKADQVSLIKSLTQIHPELISGLNFVNTSSSSAELGKELEVGMARFVKTFEALASQKDYSEIEPKMIGNAQTRIPDIENLSDEVAKKALQECYTKAAKELSAYKGQEEPGFFSIQHSVSGKIDTNGLSADLQVNADCSEIATDIIECLKGATFTDKNYISSDSLRLGQSNPFRVFMTAANGDVEAARFWRMLNCFEHHNSSPNHKEGQTAFYRIRAIYELTGGNMSYVNDKLAGLGAAKFLVWNNPLGDLYVFSTSRILKNIIESTNGLTPTDYTQALYGEITLKQSDLMSIYS